MSRTAAKPDLPEPALQLDAYLPYRLSVAANEVSRLISRAYEAKFGITVPQWRLLAIIGERGALTPQQVGALAVMDKFTVSRAAQRLIERGYVDREVNRRDGRSHILRLTPTGRQIYDTVAPLALEFERSLLEGWSKDSIAHLHEQLKMLQQRACALSGGAGPDER